MIRGNKERRIKQYLPIDHCAEGCGYVTPKRGEEIWGIPYKWLSETSLPIIEHRRNGVIITSVNVLDVAVIDFEEAQNE